MLSYFFNVRLYVYYLLFYSSNSCNSNVILFLFYYNAFVYSLYLFRGLIYGRLVNVYFFLFKMNKPESKHGYITTYLLTHRSIARLMTESAIRRKFSPPRMLKRKKGAEAELKRVSAPTVATATGTGFDTDGYEY